MNPQQPIKNFFQGLNQAADELDNTKAAQLPLSDLKAHDSSLFTLRCWYKDGNARTFHSWKQEIPNPGDSAEDLHRAKVDHQYAYERLEKFFREGVDKVGRRHFYHARTAIIYENLNDTEVLRFVFGKELYRAQLRYGTSKMGHRYLSSMVHFTKRGEPMTPMLIDVVQIQKHIAVNQAFNKQKFLEQNAKPQQP